MKVAVGTDLVRIDRITTAIDELGDAFLVRVFTERELALCAGDAQRLAGRWAAKEAAVKALGLGVDSVSLVEIEVLPAEDGRPLVRLTGAAAAAARRSEWTAWSASIAHDGDYATATVVALTLG